MTAYYILLKSHTISLLYVTSRKYLPILKGYPAKYIYEPWTAPETTQRAARCIIGKDYPIPMVNHTEASRINMERMMQVYQTLSPRTGLLLYTVQHWSI